MPKKSNNIETVACCFQGGGALGAYQVGVLQALDEAGYDPDWFVGTSIGAINAAIAAGNPPKTRIEKMKAFWDLIATPSLIDSKFVPNDELNRKIQHWLSSNVALFFGQPHFFTPRFPPLFCGYYDRPDTISFYDTNLLRETLEQFVDFDRINSKKRHKDYKNPRLSLGAVEVKSGEMVYFDSQHTNIGLDHILASGALPPGFPAVEIEGNFYWDGGLSSNSPALYVLNPEHCPQKILCFTINLFDSYGLYPKTLDEVMKRKKDLEYSSRLSKTIQLYQWIHELKNSIHILSQNIPKDKRDKPEVKLSIQSGRESTGALVRFLYEHDDTEFSSKDYEFSQKTIEERIKIGYLDGKRAVKKSPWNKAVANTRGLALFDMSPNKLLRPIDKAK